MADHPRPRIEMRQSYHSFVSVPFMAMIVSRPEKSKSPPSHLDTAAGPV
jgi:hypothetical protein